MRVRSLVLYPALLALSACAAPYYWQAIGGQLELLRKRTPITAILADETADTELRKALASIVELRRFAVTRLALLDNDSYTTYVDLGRPYVVWNVIATQPFSVEAERWCFPFAGCVSYRGYFDRAAAERFRQRLEADGLDTYSGGSGAYSTLGYFNDPVLSTMLGGAVEDRAGVLFHELAHQRVYVAGDSELSEAFATAVEEHGVELWLREQVDAESLERYRQRLLRRAQFADLIARQQERLREIFSMATDASAKLDAKAAAFAALAVEYAELKRSWGGAADYDAWFAQPLNNATLAAVATYRRWLPALKRRIGEVGLEQFYIDVEELAPLPELERAARLKGWAGAGINVPSSGATSRAAAARD